MNDLLSDKPHIRKNILTGETVLVSPHRLKRPWQGKTEEIQSDTRPAYDPKCYLCPGNTRANGEVNPQYSDTFIFTNDFAALLPEKSDAAFLEADLLSAEPISGTCRVVCFSPRHDLTLAEMTHGQILKVVDAWTQEFEALSKKEEIAYVQIFENRGALMGCSNPHPHGQIWATSNVPYEVHREDFHQKNWFDKKGTLLLNDYINLEMEKEERIVVQNESWAVVVPWWAKWPFETLVVPINPKPNLLSLDEKQKSDLADIIRQLTIRYDNLFEISFPYTMGFHQAPCDVSKNDHWCMHAHFYPPLLRSATVQKFMVGFEMLAMPQRDLTPEQAAKMLRALPAIHYKEKKSGASS